MSTHTVHNFCTNERVLDHKFWSFVLHWNKKIEELRAKLALGEEIIRRKDRPSKLKTIYKQVVDILDSQLIFEIKEGSINLREPFATNYRHNRQIEINTYRKQIDSVWLPYILSDEIRRMSREDRSIDPNAPQMALTHNVSSNVSDLPQNTDQSSSSSNNRELLDVSNTELSESFLLKKKQDEEIQRLNTKFEAQLRVDRARYERKRQELEEQTAELEKKRLDTEIEKEKQHAMRSQLVLTGAATSATSHKKVSAEANQEDGPGLSDVDVNEENSKFSDKSNGFSSSKYKPSRERSPSLDNSRYFFNRQRDRSSSAERDYLEFE